jgi:hypothetical protein
MLRAHANKQNIAECAIVEYLRPDFGLLTSHLGTAGWLSKILPYIYSNLDISPTFFTFSASRMKSFFLTRLLPALVLAIAFAGTVLAQSPSTGGPAPGTPAVDVPLDGGASLLLAGGVAYGLKRLRDRRKKA